MCGNEPEPGPEHRPAVGAFGYHRPDVGTDVKDMLDGSAETMEGIKTLDPERVAIGSATMVAALAGVFVPGNVSGLKKAQDAALGKKNAPKGHLDLEGEIKQNWPDASRQVTTETNEAFRNSWIAYNKRKNPSWTPETSEKAFHPPYDESFPSFIVKTKEVGQKFVRVVPKGKENEPSGRWLMRKQDFEDIMASPDGIMKLKEKFALPEAPFAWTEVSLPKEMELRIGKASAHPEWGLGGGLQFEITDEFSKKWFSKSVPIARGVK